MPNGREGILMVGLERRNRIISLAINKDQETARGCCNGCQYLFFSEPDRVTRKISVRAHE